MINQFGVILANLRRDSNLNQRQLAAELRISQALLSHYENGTREPGLDFVCRVCDHFGVTADFILGREAPQAGSAGIVSPTNALEFEFSVVEDPAARRAAEDYVRASARRVLAQISSPNSPLDAAIAAAEMSEAELRLLRALSE